VVEEGLLVRDDVGVVETGEDSDFVEGVLLLLLGEGFQFHFFEGVDLVVFVPSHFVDAGVGAQAELF
jgi:hypothetical protein